MIVDATVRFAISDDRPAYGRLLDAESFSTIGK